MKLKDSYGQTQDQAREEALMIATEFRRLLWSAAETADTKGLAVRVGHNGWGHDLFYFTRDGVGLTVAAKMMGRYTNRYVDINFEASTRFAKWGVSVESPRRAGWMRLGDATPEMILLKASTVLTAAKKVKDEVAEVTRRRDQVKQDHETTLGFALKGDMLNAAPQGDGTFKLTINNPITVAQARAIREITGP